MKVWISGACGYVGAALVPRLLAARHKVVAFDTQFFGNGYLPDNGSLTVVKGDILDVRSVQASLAGCEVVVHLAGLTSDKSCQLHPALSQQINVHGLKLVSALTKNIYRRIFLSSAAIFGGETTYVKAKKECEEFLSGSYWTILRPGSVCGYSPRMRFDLPVNQMTRDAMLKGEITVNGGKQKRTNLHINDLCDTINALFVSKGGTYNVNSENLTILETARKVAAKTGASIHILDYTDGRSYEMQSDLTTTRTVDEAIRDMIARFKDGYWKDVFTNPGYMNVYGG